MPMSTAQAEAESAAATTAQRTAAMAGMAHVPPPYPGGHNGAPYFAGTWGSQGSVSSPTQASHSPISPVVYEAGQGSSTPMTRFSPHYTDYDPLGGFNPNTDLNGAYAGSPAHLHQRPRGYSAVPPPYHPYAGAPQYVASSSHPLGGAPGEEIVADMIYEAEAHEYTQE